MPRVSIYGSGVEERDLRLADDWTALAYDDSAWAAPRLVAPVGGYPWTDLRLRTLPLLSEREIPITLLETRLLTSPPPPALFSSSPRPSSPPFSSPPHLTKLRERAGTPPRPRRR
ncbi:MAG: hypothetical protein U0401_24515 [Anaerolineae bacterium]